MPARLEIPKTFKLFIGGQFIRSESGRSLPIAAHTGETVAHISRASRKDLRNAVEAARAALAKWSGATAYNRGQVLYRVAEMLEARKSEFIDLLRAHGASRRHAALEIEATIDRLVCFAGWADKFAQVLGCNNPVAGPYYNFTVPEPTGIVSIIAPDEPALLGLVALLAPPLCAGNTIVALASQTHPLPAAVLGEACATGDIPAGAINILTGERDELIPHIAAHRDIDAIHAAGLSLDHARALRDAGADNVKRIVIHGERVSKPRGGKTSSIRPIDFTDEASRSPWWIEPFVEFKTIWHPSSA